jgi:hypothetical protein
MSKVVHSLLPQERDALAVKFNRLRKEAGMKPMKSHMVTHIDIEDNEKKNTLVKVCHTFQEQGQVWELHGEFERPASKIPPSIPRSFILKECKNNDAFDSASLEVEAMRIQALHMGTSS